jgi:AraC family transcriptional regulator, transcriptional activator of pobA
MENKAIDTKNKLDNGLTFKVSRFKELIKKTRPHKHDAYFELVFLAAGEGFHTIEAETFQVKAPEFYFLKPGQMHFWQFTSIPKGYVVLFSADEFSRITEPEMSNLYTKLLPVTQLGLTQEQFPETILAELLHEYQLQSDYSKTILHGLLKALLGKLLRLSQHQFPTVPIAPSIYERFELLLLKNCPRLHKVHEYAELLHTTPQNLSAACKKQSQQSASELINTRILLEAKRYILHTDNTITEIADLLHFNDPSNFVKFFKKAVGLTPTQFRSQYFQ